MVLQMEILMETQSKSILARLLANENVTVQRGNYKTAFFDVESRVLGLPLITNDYGSDVEDLFIGHEVGHALFTPAAGWHDSPVEMQVPRSFLNVVEDIRIERKIQEKYPGLSTSFKKGYKKFSDLNFFETQGQDISQYSFIDRLNLKSKLRTFIDVDFSSEEKPYVDMAMSCDTWDDVVKAAKAIYDFMLSKKEKDNLKDSEPESSEDNFSDADENEVESSTPSSNELPNLGDDDENSDAESKPDNTESSDAENKPDNTESSDAENSDTKADPDDTEQSSSTSGEPENEELVSKTDEAFRKNENRLTEQKQGLQPAYVAPMSRNIFNDMLIPYSEVKAARSIEANPYGYKTTHAYLDAINEYPNFIAETKKVTSILVKEFEMRKAAFRTLRATQSNCGSINVNKLHSYKYDDDIFMRVTNLADAQSHGMVMLIDYSGSMQSIIGQVIIQALNLAMFCKRVNIPFDIYGFTGGESEYSYTAPRNLAPGEIFNSHKIRIFHLLSSSFNKAEYEEAYKELFALSKVNYYLFPKVESLGSTPLNAALLGFKHIFSDFKSKYGVQKLNFIVLSDGASSDLYVHSIKDKEIYNSVSSRNYALDFNNKIQNVTRENLTDVLISEYSKMGINTICFYIAERNSDIKNAAWMVSDDKYDWHARDKIASDIRTAFRKEKLKLYENTCGYNKFFILKGDKESLDTNIEDLEIDANASRSQIRKAFSEYSSSKKISRVLASKFAEAVA
jgi:hypothetical protein